MSTKDLSYQDKINSESDIEEEEDIMPKQDELDDETRKIAFSKTSKVSFEINLEPNTKPKKHKKDKSNSDSIDIDLFEKRDSKKLNPRPLPPNWNGEISVEEYNKKHNLVKKEDKPIGGFPSLGNIKINKPLVNKMWGKIITE